VAGEAVDTALNECDMLKQDKQQLSLELQQVQQNMDEQALLSKAVVEHLQKSVTKLEEEKFEMQVEMEELQNSLQAKQMESDKPKLTNGECDSQTHMTEEYVLKLKLHEDEVCIKLLDHILISFELKFWSSRFFMVQLG
jgi:predicted RNase H-like nuclease (RuvC/YqgF family)